MITQPLSLMWLYLFIAAGLTLASIPRYRLFAIIPALALSLYAFAAGFLALWPLLALLGLMALAYIYLAGGRWLSQGARQGWLLYGAIVPLALLIAFRAFPGVTNPLLFADAQLSSVARTFSIYLSIDKGVLAVLLWAVASHKGVPAAATPLRFMWLIPLMWLVVFSAGMISGYVIADVKWPEWSLHVAWITGTLLVTCALEEAFFRGVVQRGLMAAWQGRFRYGSVAALLFTSLLFGLAHIGGGWLFVLLATLAGLFYGLGYWLTGRLWFAVLLHFLLNWVHFVLFSYPGLL